MPVTNVFSVVEFVCKSCLAALEAVETLKSVREDVTVRIMDPAETASTYSFHFLLDIVQ